MTFVQNKDKGSHKEPTKKVFSLSSYLKSHFLTYIDKNLSITHYSIELSWLLSWVDYSVELSWSIDRVELIAQLTNIDYSIEKIDNHSFALSISNQKIMRLTSVNRNTMEYSKHKVAPACLTVRNPNI